MKQSEGTPVTSCTQNILERAAQKVRFMACWSNHMFHFYKRKEFKDEQLNPQASLLEMLQFGLKDETKVCTKHWSLCHICLLLYVSYMSPIFRPTQCLYKLLVCSAIILFKVRDSICKFMHLCSTLNEVLSLSLPVSLTQYVELIGMPDRHRPEFCRQTVILNLHNKK